MSNFYNKPFLVDQLTQEQMEEVTEYYKNLKPYPGIGDDIGNFAEYLMTGIVGRWEFVKECGYTIHRKAEVVWDDAENFGYKCECAVKLVFFKEQEEDECPRCSRVHDRNLNVLRTTLDVKSPYDEGIGL